jgi:hypothetical protein
VTPDRVPDELEVVLLLAGTRERRSLLGARIRELLARADFDRLAGELDARRLLPLIGSRAIVAGDELVPQSFRAAVSRALMAERARGLANEGATRRVSAWLAEAGLRSLPLKGPMLAAEVHEDIGMRSTSDVDLLVAEADLDRAAQVLVDRGFAPPRDVRRANGLPDLHLYLEHAELPPVELHWRIHWYERAFSADVLERAAPGPDGLLRPAPDDLAASLLLFYARDGFHGVRQAADLAGWWERRAGEMAEAFLESHARRYPELAPALTASARVVAQFTGTPATEWLGNGASSGRRVGLATRLADWTQVGDRDQLRANVSLVNGLLGPRSYGRAFAHRELLSYGDTTLDHAAHVAKRFARYTLALWRVRGSRRWAPLPGSATR